MNRRLPIYFRKNEEELLRLLKKLSKQIGISLNDTIKLLINIALTNIKEDPELQKELKIISITHKIEYYQKLEEKAYKARKSLLRSSKYAYLYEDMNEIKSRKERLELLPEPIQTQVKTLDQLRHYYTTKIGQLTNQLKQNLIKENRKRFGNIAILNPMTES